MKKYKSIKSCANCLRQTKDCTCSSKFTAVVEECSNCENWLDEEWNYCPFCGYEIESKSCK